MDAHNIQDLLKVSYTNGKLSPRNIVDLPAGKTCHGAKLCRSMAIKTKTGTKIVDGGETLFRCFAASQEAQYPAVYAKRDYNHRLLIDAIDQGRAADLIDKSINKNLLLTRIHSSGDFFRSEYLEAWLEVANHNPNNIFYCYSKALDLFMDRGLPKNFFLTASYGGVHDHLIDEGYFRRFAKVVNNEAEAEALGLPIDHDDSHCMTDGPFALLVHGTQPKGSLAAQELALRRKQNKFAGYSKKSLST